MNTIPEWVTSAVGIYAILGSIFMVVMIVVAGVLVRVLLDLKDELRRLSNRVDGIAQRVDSVAKEVQTVTGEVGVRTSGLLRLVDDAAGPALGAVERYGPLFLVVGAALRLFFAAKRFSPRR